MDGHGRPPVVAAGTGPSSSSSVAGGVSAATMMMMMTGGRPGHGRTADVVTPHKIVVLVYAREVCRLKSARRGHKEECAEGRSTAKRPPSVIQSADNDAVEVGSKASEAAAVDLKPPPSPFIDGRQRRQFAITMLELIQDSDLHLGTLLNRIKAASSDQLFEAIVQRIREMATDGVSGIMDFIQSLETLLVDPSHQISIVHKSSVIGLFVRRMMLAFDKLSFGQTTALHAAYRRYCRRLIPNSGDSECDDSANSADPASEDDDDEGVDVAWLPTASRMQAELFLARQVALLTTNDGATMTPSKLQNRINQLLATNPNLPEAHFLSVMNCLRCQEYVGAVNALHRAFDCCPTIEQHDKPKSSSGDQQQPDAPQQQQLQTQNFRFAALNLGSLLCRFGYRDEALLALQEAMKMAREANDNVCLQHAQSWQYRLESDRKEALVERSITKAGEMSLPYLASLGILVFSQMKSSTAAKPAIVFDFLRKCDIINCQHSILELMTQSYSQKASLWSAYGKKPMASLAVQLLLYLNTSKMASHSSPHCDEALCRALCQMALLFSDEGNYGRAEEILSLAKEKFPCHSPHSDVWMFFEQVVRFDRALKHCDWSEASVAISNLSTLNVHESHIREAEILLYRGEIVKAQQLLNKLNSDEAVGTDFAVRVLILLGLCHCHADNSAMAVMPLCSAYTLAHQHHLVYLQAVATLHLAFALYLMGHPSKATDLMDASKVHFLSNGTVFDRARVLLLHGKCRVARAKTTTSTEVTTSVLQEAAVEMGRAANQFLQAEAYRWAKDAFRRQAILYDELGFIEDRNRAAFQFRKLDQQNSTGPSTLSELL